MVLLLQILFDLAIAAAAEAILMRISATHDLCHPCTELLRGTLNWSPSLRVSKQGPCFTAIEEDGSDKRLVELELACEVDGIAPPDPV